MTQGRKSLLDEHLFREIKDLVLEGKNLRQISESLEIPYATMRDWEYENYKSFSDKMLSFKHERIFKKAEANLEQLMEGDDERIRADLSKFALETLHKKYYSKRTEQTGADGKDLPVPILGYVSSNNITEQNKPDDQKDTDSTGGNIS